MNAGTPRQSIGVLVDPRQAAFKGVYIYMHIYVCRTFGVYLRKALVAIFNTMPSGAGPGLADLKFRKFRNLKILEIVKYF